ncbi:MAG: acetyl-CoA hydrolase/transferase family protein [Anaerovoracaceae bacterium]
MNRQIPAEFETEYAKKLRTPQQAAAEIRDGERIVTATSSSQPRAFLRSLADRTYELKDVHLVGSFLADDYEFLKEEAHGHINVLISFLGVKSREYFFRKRMTDNIEVYSYDFSRTEAVMEQLFRPDVFVFESPLPDEKGNFSFGVIGAMYGRSAADYVKNHGGRIIVQVNPSVPFVYSGREEDYINIRDVDIICESEEEIFPVPLSEPTETEAAIARRILPYIHDGATLQLGFGGIANAIGFSLGDRQHLGIHTESYVDSMMYLEKQGAVDNSMKNVGKGVSQAAFIMGTRELYDWADRNRGISTMPISYITSPHIIAQINDFISINSCMNCDLTGQVGSESIGLRQFSSQGGQVAFVHGAGLSQGGRSFLCMKSFNRKKDGEMVSTIDLGLPYGTAVTTPRHEVDCIVTEWGCAELKYKPLNQRAIALINIAHPDFRKKLYDEALANRIIAKHQAYRIDG